MICMSTLVEEAAAHPEHPSCRREEEEAYPVDRVEVEAPAAVVVAVPAAAAAAACLVEGGVCPAGEALCPTEEEDPPCPWHPRVDRPGSRAEEEACETREGRL